MDSRLQKISKLISEYSLGNFKRKLKISPKQDEIDAFISGINMLGEELKSTTISKNYLNSIFNSISEPIIIINRMGNVIDINQMAINLLSFDVVNNSNKFINDLLQTKEINMFSFLKKGLIKELNTIELQTDLDLQQNKKIPVLITMSHFFSGKGKKDGYILSVKDITAQKENKDIVVKTIIETQEKERLRFSRDIHDSLGQQLSAFKFIIGTQKQLAANKNIVSMLSSMNDIVIGLQAEMRNICFNLMPKTLETVNLIAAVHELCAQVKITSALKFSIAASEKFPVLEKALETSLFRIVQEFINNSLKHGKATVIRIDFRNTKSDIYMHLRDNGSGFSLKKTNVGLHPGIGLKNIQSRVDAYNGTILIKSRNGKGTEFFITIPNK